MASPAPSPNIRWPTGPRFADYRRPIPTGPMACGRSTAQVAQDIEDAKAQGKLLQTGLRHGHTFLQLCDLRGDQVLMYDMADDDPRLRWLIALLEEFNLAIVERDLAVGVEWMSYPEDLGTKPGRWCRPGIFASTSGPATSGLMRRAGRRLRRPHALRRRHPPAGGRHAEAGVQVDRTCRTWSTASTGSRRALPARCASTWTSTASRSPSAARPRRSMRSSARR